MGGGGVTTAFHVGVGLSVSGAATCDGLVTATPASPPGWPRPVSVNMRSVWSVSGHTREPVRGLQVSSVIHRRVNIVVVVVMG